MTPCRPYTLRTSGMTRITQQRRPVGQPLSVQLVEARLKWISVSSHPFPGFVLLLSLMKPDNMPVWPHRGSVQVMPLPLWSSLTSCLQFMLSRAKLPPHCRSEHTYSHYAHVLCNVCCIVVDISSPDCKRAGVVSILPTAISNWHSISPFRAGQTLAGVVVLVWKYQVHCIA